MKLFKLDLMTVLFIVVAIGVVVTMTTQASTQMPVQATTQDSSRSVDGLAQLQMSAQMVDTALSTDLPQKR